MNTSLRSQGMKSNNSSSQVFAPYGHDQERSDAKHDNGGDGGGSKLLRTGELERSRQEEDEEFEFRDSESEEDRSPIVSSNLDRNDVEYTLMQC